MRSVKGIYDGEVIKVLEDVTDLQPGKVIITFVEEKDDVESLRSYSADEDAFHFWKEDEDLYQDFLKEVKMKCGDIVLIPFPFSELTDVKVRPAVVITKTADKYKDLVLSGITSQLPEVLNDREIYLTPSLVNGLRIPSIIKADRLFTLKSEKVIHLLGRLTNNELISFKEIIRSLVD